MGTHTMAGPRAYGKGWLEKTSKGRVRAVKEVDKMVQMDHLKEVMAIAKFSKVCILDIRLWVFA